MRKLDKGSALLITLMVLVVLSLTGLSFIFLADTENLISNNYYRAMTTLVTAQTGVYAVNTWFNSPSRTADLVPTKDEMIIASRSYAPDSDGTATLWKGGGLVAGVRLFDKPYAGAVDSDTAVHQFFGTEASPDVRFDIAGATLAQRDFMRDLNEMLFGVTYDGDVQVPQGGGVHIVRMSLYAPPVGPYADAPTDPANQAYGICTVLVEAENVNPSGQTVSTRRVRGIITDINYAVMGEALDVDGPIDINGSCRTHWGNIKSTENIDDNNQNFVAAGSPWYSSPSGQVKMCGALMGTYDAASDTGTQPYLDGDTLEDPWLLVRSRRDMVYSKHGLNANCNGGLIKWPQPAEAATRLILAPVDDWVAGANSANNTCDFVYDAATKTTKLKSYWKCKPFDPGATDNCPGFPNPIDPTPPDENWLPTAYTNYWGCDPSVAFATAFRGYNYWKRVVLSVSSQGGAASKNVHYLVPGGYAEVNGLCDEGEYDVPGSTANCKTFEAWTVDKEGFWFFDTTDGKVPQQDRSNIPVGQDCKGKYASQGLIYLCADYFENSGGSHGEFDITMPGEPLWENPDPLFRHLMNGRYDAEAEVDGVMQPVDRFINLEYPDRPYGASMNQVNTYRADEDYENATKGLTKGWDQYGPEVQNVEGVFKGIFYVTGDVRAVGSRAFWGSLMIWNGKVRTSGTVDVWYDPRLTEGLQNLGLPNSYIEQIQTDM